MSIKTPIDLSIGYLNIEGLHTSTFGCKLPHLQSKLIHDIEVLSEAWGVCTHSKDVPGYKILANIEPSKKTNIKKADLLERYSYTAKIIYLNLSR